MLNPLRDHSLLNLGLGTEGIVHIEDCYQAGLTDRKVRWLIDSGRWQLVHPRVIAVFSGPLPYRAMLHAAVKYAGRGAVLSHETAGFEYGLCAKPPITHVTVPYEREVDRRAVLIVHRSRTLGPRHVMPGTLPRTTVERTVVDLLGSKRSADAALGLVGERFGLVGQLPTGSGVQSRKRPVRAGVRLCSTRCRMSPAVHSPRWRCAMRSSDDAMAFPRATVKSDVRVTESRSSMSSSLSSASMLSWTDGLATTRHVSGGGTCAETIGASSLVSDTFDTDGATWWIGPVASPSSRPLC